ncbi:hypothetical protein [Mucilaginibacter defluvii]
MQQKSTILPPISPLFTFGAKRKFVSTKNQNLKNMAKAFLEITLQIDNADRANAAGIYTKYKAPFLERIEGASSKELLIRDEDVQVLHGFESADQASAYLSSELFTNDVVVELKPYLKATPEVRIYTVA